jgi:hypothetical protein
MTDIFRQEYRELTVEEKILVSDTKESAANLLDCLEEVKDDHCRAIAITKLEECVMWAVKGITG